MLILRCHRAITLTTAALLAGGLLALTGLGHHPFWSDEANTALYARNLIQTGQLTAWDGTNLIGFMGKPEFTEQLENVFMPPQQYVIAAAGLLLAGSESRAGARLPFVLFGLAAAGVTAWCAYHFFGPRFPCYLPAWILALCPAYLLFIRNCRYYALANFWTMLLLGLWIRHATASAQSPELRPRRSSVLIQVAGVFAFLALFTSQHLNGAAVLAALPVFFMDGRFRTRRQLVFLGSLYVTGALCLAWLAWRSDPTETLLDERNTILGWLTHTIVLLWRYVRDLGYFEIFAWPMVLAFALPWLLPRLRPDRAIAARAMVLLLAFLAFLVAVSVLSPQGLTHTEFAVMRYIVPLIAVGALVTAAAVRILCSASKPIAIAVVATLILTNTLHIGANFNRMPPTLRQTYYGHTMIRSTLLDYVRELFAPFESTNEKILETLDEIPDESTVWCTPHGIGISAMFERPDLKFNGQLWRNTDLGRRLADRLPAYVFWDAPSPDVLVALAFELDISKSKIVLLSDFLENRVHGFLESDRFTDSRTIPVYGTDETRPEVPFRLYFEPPESRPPLITGLVLTVKPFRRVEKEASQGSPDDSGSAGLVDSAIIAPTVRSRWR